MATALVQVRYYYQFTKKVVLPAANVILSAKDKSLKQEINCAYLVAILIKTGNVRINVILRSVCVTSVVRKKTVGLAYYESASVDLIIQHAMRMRHTQLSSGACLALLHFSTLSQKRHAFRKTVTGHKVCVLIFSTNFIQNISHSKKNSLRYFHNCTNVFAQRARPYSQILIKFEFSLQTFEKFSNIKFHENPSNISQIFPCRRTDKLT